MTRKRESVARSLAVAGAVALFCSLLVSAAVYWLRPVQAAYQSIERNRAIVSAAGLAPGDGTLSDREVVSRYLELERRLVDLGAGRFVDADDSLAAYDYRSAIDDTALTEAIAPEADTAGLGRRPRLMPVYMLGAEESLERLVLPVYGRGMWSTIHGFVGLGPDLETVAGVYFHEQGETPGIGDRIQGPTWLAQWRGKRMYADDGTLVLRVGGRATDTTPADRVDAITGATVTVTAVDKLVSYWFGEDGYGPFLADLRGRRQ